MDRDYDIFEQFPDGFPLWRGRAVGLRDASLKLHEIAKHTANECFALHLPTKEVVERLNVRGGKPVVFQICYDEALGAERTHILRLHGYEVISVFGNDAAKVVLSNSQKCDFFIVGHNAPEDIRKEIAAWIKGNYPHKPVLALNAPGIPVLLGADFNVKINGPETWLPLLSVALRPPPQMPARPEGR